MSIDFTHYVGREPAYVKHTFLDKYLPALIARVCHAFDDFVYVDGFAGPWKSAAGETFADTSFGIALRHMTTQKQFFAARGRRVRMKAFLVEKNGSTFSALENAVRSYPDVECVPLKGDFEDHAVSINSAIPRTAFSFVLVDPKGFPDVERILPLLSRTNAEALINFMFDFANRFAGTELIPALERWLSSGGDAAWRMDVDRLSGADREDRLEELAVAKLRREAKYKYAPVISVDKPLHDRTLYKLIFLSRHPSGLEVFRNSENSALEAQALSRSKSKAVARESKSGMPSLFGGQDAIPYDRSSVRLKEGEIQAKCLMLASLNSAPATGMRWSELWPPILDATVITRSKLGNMINQMRKNGEIEAPHWPSERHRIPHGDQVLKLPRDL